MKLKDLILQLKNELKDIERESDMYSAIDRKRYEKHLSYLEGQSVSTSHILYLLSQLDLSNEEDIKQKEHDEMYKWFKNHVNIEEQ